MSLTTKLKHIWSMIMWPILFGIGQFVVIAIFSFSFQTREWNHFVEAHPDLSKLEQESQFSEWLDQDEYVESLSGFLEEKSLLMVTINAIIFLPIFVFLLRKKTIIKPFPILPGGIVILGAIALALSANLLFSLCSDFFSFNRYQDASFPLWTSIVASCLLGPIVEEYLFRGVVYDRAKAWLKPTLAMILTSLLFAMFHTTWEQQLYAIAISMFFLLALQKFSSLPLTIVAHIGANLAVSLLGPILFPLAIGWRVVLFLICLILFLVSLWRLKFVTTWKVSKNEF